MTSIDLPNYYKNNKPLKIKLDPALSPARNAQNTLLVIKNYVIQLNMLMNKLN